MRIIDLDEKRRSLYFVCLEDWNRDFEQVAEHKARWYARATEQGLRVKLALDELGQVGGMIQYLPIEHAPAVGQNAYFVLCVWVHGHPHGRGSFQHQGMGSALLAAAEADARALGAKGMAARGLVLPFWMRASWFKKRGYRKVDRDGIMNLMWKPFVADAVEPRWLPSARRHPELEAGKVVVTACVNGWCPSQNLNFERMTKAVEKQGDRVVLRVVDTRDKPAMLEWGSSDALFVDSHSLFTGPALSQDKLDRMLERRVKKLRHAS